MSFGMVAASYLGVTGLLPEPLLSFGFNEGMGNSFSPTHGSANTYAGGGSIEWGSSLPGHGTAAVRTAQDTFTQTLVADNINVSPSAETWTALTVMCWYRPLAMTYGADRVPFAFYGADNMDWLGIAQHSDGRLEAWIGGDNTAVTTGAIADDTWAHLALVWDGSMLSFYIDGVVAESRSTTETVGELYYIRLSGAPWSHAGGAIDDFRLFNVALTPEQIAAFMAEGV